MSVKISFNSFRIQKINYNIGQNSETPTNYSMRISKIDMGISKDKKLAEIIINGQTKNDKHRILDLKVSYFYSLNYSNDNLEEYTTIKKYLEEYGINTSIVMYENLIKSVTSLDYNEPMIANGYDMPGSIKKVED